MTGVTLGLPIVFVDRGRRRVFEAVVLARFDPDTQGEQFSCKTGALSPAGTVLAIADEGTTWSRDTTPTGQDALLAAYLLEVSA